MRQAKRFVAAVRLDAAEVLRSRWLFFCGGVYAILAAIFVFVGGHESSVMGFTGMGRALLAVSHALVLLLPLLALTATAHAVNRAREDGTLELLFSQPLSRSAWFGAVSLTRYLTLVVPLAALMLAMGLLGRVVFGEEVPWAFLARAVAVSATLLLAFVGIGLAVSTLVRNPARATIYVLLIWAASVALLDFALVAMMLRWHLNARAVFLLASLNPVQAARMALLSAADPELGILGPVGFYLSTRVGPGGLLALGLATPAAVGLAAWGVALRAFTRGDAV